MAGSTPGPFGTGFWGKSSWFGGPNDSTTGNTTASGAPITQPGIAVYNRGTLGGWWAIKAPNGAIGIVQQTDIGPAPWTGKTFDYTYSLLPLFGYSQQNFPTGGQTFGYYLGQNMTDLSLNLNTALGKLGATPTQQAALIQAGDVGTLMQGGKAVVAPPNQAPGTTLPGQGQSPSGSSAVPAGPSLPDIPGAITGAFNQAVTDAKYAAVLIGALVIAVVLMTHGITGQTPASIARKAPV